MLFELKRRMNGDTKVRKLSLGRNTIAGDAIRMEGVVVAEVYKKTTFLNI